MKVQTINAYFKSDRQLKISFISVEEANNRQP